MTPAYKHDCDRCTFHGHWFGVDVYTCMQFDTLKTIIARRSSEPSDYFSMPLTAVRDFIRDESFTVTTLDGNVVFREYIFAKPDHWRAWLLALALVGIDKELE